MRKLLHVSAVRLDGRNVEVGGDMTAMCDMHKKMMAMSPQDRKAMMDTHMKNMSPEMRAQQMDKMKQCM